MEFLDIVDENGLPTGETVERTFAHANGILHRTSHVWLIRKKASGQDILLQKRSINKDSYPGCFDISSAGHIPAGCGFTESAVRELHEELGIEVSEKDLILCGTRRLRYKDIFHGATFSDNQVSNVYILITTLDICDMTMQPSEVDDLKWMDFDECIEAVRNNTIKHCIYMEELDMVKKKLQDI